MGLNNKVPLNGFLHMYTLLLGNYLLGVPLKTCKWQQPKRDLNEKDIMVGVGRYWFVSILFGEC